jgi:2-amino-4-hydroxy-6-hydroxymethyldihydropteridine diphosphokinase
VARAFLSLGSNIDPERNLRRALAALETLSESELWTSPSYRSAAVGFDGPDFLNLVASLETSLTPLQLWRSLRAIEAALGRRREGQAKHSSRTADLDLLLYDDLVSSEVGELVLPHPDVLRYDFVLRPLAELAPEQVHPVEGATLGALWAERRRHSRGLVAVVFKA